MTINRFLLEQLAARIKKTLPPFVGEPEAVPRPIGEGDAGGMYENEALEISDLQLKELMRQNALGYPMTMPVEIEDPENGDMWTLPWEPLVTLKGKNLVVCRQAAKTARRGTIKEHWTQGDYEISIQGILMDCFDEQHYPEEDVRRLRRICEARRELKVNCMLLEIFDISRIVIMDFDIPFTKGENAQAYSLKACSDDWFDLLIDETSLKQA